MPRKKWIDKSKSTTYQLVHRELADPLIHDASSSSMVFQELAPSQSHKPRNRRDLENELFGGSDLSSQSSTSSHGKWHVRDNEGEAAEHGVYFDDTEYDYMQHMRDLSSNSGGATSVWFEAPGSPKDKSKGKEKQQSLADALEQLDLEHEREKSEVAGRLTDPSILPSLELKRQTYQDQQDVPDALAGFQPDMDPRLREVLEALEDEAYVDADADAGEELFKEIAVDRREVSLEEFEDMVFWEGEEGDEEGWESDRTIRPEDVDGRESKTIQHTPTSPSTSDPQPESTLSTNPALPDPSLESQAEADGAFMSTFRSLPPSIKKPAQAPPSLISSLASHSSILPPGTKRKKRKGALTDPSSFSMTSSSLPRTEAQSTLDARFDRLLEIYEQDDEDDGGDEIDDTSSLASGVSGVSGVSKTSEVSRASGASWQTTSSTRSLKDALAERKDWEGVMDEFLGNNARVGGGVRRSRGNKGGNKMGMQELDEIRRELGPARIRA